MIGTHPEKGAHRRAALRPPIRSVCSPQRIEDNLGDCLGARAEGTPLLHNRWDIGQARKALGEIAGLVRSPQERSESVDYQCVLRCLAGLVRELLARQNPDPLPLTATDYATVVEMISRRHPELDYRETIAQLLQMMSRLLRAGNRGWRTINRRLHAIAPAAGVDRALAGIFVADIHEWFYAGIQDLFEYRGRVRDELEELDRRSAAILEERRAERAALAELRRELGAAPGGRVRLFDEKRRERVLAELDQSLHGLQEERDAKARALALIEADVRDFHDRLHQSRRLLMLRAV